MGDRTSIEWTDSTWNPVRGCSRISSGCVNCYAERVAHRFSGPGKPYEGLTNEHGRWNGTVRLVPNLLDQPLRWRKPRRVFVNSMSDLFHESLPYDVILRVFVVMSSLAARRHTFQILTKRAERAAELAPKLPWSPNVWMGVSVENQAAADERIPHLLQIPAAVRFLSCEPLLGPVELWRWDEDEQALRGPAVEVSGTFTPATPFAPSEGIDTSQWGIHWVIAGAESMPGKRPGRPADDQWLRDLRDQCVAAGVPFFLKQAERAGRIVELPELDGKVWAEFPREAPRV